MNRCDQGRRLFGAYWDDEVTQAEREWLESHLASCVGCRQQYEQFARTLETVGSLPRTDTATDLPERALAAARHAAAVPDHVTVAVPRPAWVPLAAAAGVLVVSALALLPLTGPHDGGPKARLALDDKPVAQARIVRTSSSPAGGLLADRGSASASSTLADSLFDHADDVEFILDPVVLHRGRARAVSHLPAGVQGEQTVISF